MKSLPELLNSIKGKSPFNTVPWYVSACWSMGQPLYLFLAWLININ